MTDNLLKWSVAIGQARKEAFDIRHLYFNIQCHKKQKKTIQKNKEEPRWI
jgi:hypothetical protein